MKRCELHETEGVGGMSAPVRRRQIAYVCQRGRSAQYPRHGYRRIQVFLARRRSGEQLDLDCANGNVVRDLPTLRA